MDANDLIKKVRKIEIKTRGLSQNIFAGEYHSAFKGRGMMFSEVREYQYGDDIRELTVMLLVDVSRSRLFGAVGEEKREMIAEIAATLAFSAIQNNDKIGVIFFSNKIEKFIPPKKGRKHILFIISQLLDFQPENNGTDIAEALRFFTDALKKRTTTFLISDFIDENDFSKALTIASNKHDVIGIQVYDKRDSSMPDVGLIKMQDLETGETKWVDTNKSMRSRYNKWWYGRQQSVSETMMKNHVDFVSVATDEDYVKALMLLFKNRGIKK